MINIETNKNGIPTKYILTFLSITLFYFFEYAQMSYFNVLAPHFLNEGIYNQNQIGSLSAAYYYGDVIGLLPVGIFLDRLPLRKVLLWAIFGSVISAFLLVISHNFYIEWLARFFCGFFGGTFSFLGGIRVIAYLFPNRFTFFIGVFLSAGMLGGLLCQYPLLLVANHMGSYDAMLIMAMFGVLVIFINFLYLHPLEHQAQSANNKYPGTVWQMCVEIFKNYRNWCDCLLVVLLDSPISIIGTLWGIVLLTGLYHFSPGASAWIVMCMFAGLMIGSPICGELSDRYNHPAWMVSLSSGVSFLLLIFLLIIHHPSVFLVALIFFCLGIFTSCQTLVFSWLTKNMRPELIGRNSAFNSMILMGSGGLFKQIGAYLLILPAFLIGLSSAVNLLILITVTMLLAAIYAVFRRRLFVFKENEI